LHDLGAHRVLIHLHNEPIGQIIGVRRWRWASSGVLCHHMPRGVGVLEWIVVNVRVAIQTLRIAWVGHNGVRLHKPPYDRVVVAGTVVVQARAVIQPLAGELVAGGHGACRTTARFVLDIQEQRGCAVDDAMPLITYLTWFLSLFLRPVIMPSQSTRVSRGWLERILVGEEID